LNVGKGVAALTTCIHFSFTSVARQIRSIRQGLEETMKKLSMKLLGVVIISATLSSAITPAFALGGCGPNRHRNGWGQCVWGGQNEDWCLRTTGHPATRMPNGTLRCLHY
jgi:hypothetical protein